MLRHITLIILKPSVYVMPEKKTAEPVPTRIEVSEKPKSKNLHDGFQQVD